MEGISKEVNVLAPQEIVYRAVSTPEGLHGWWCKALTTDKNSGLVQLSFSSGHLYHISLAKGGSTERVEWDVPDHNVWPEWVGTRLVFDIEGVRPNSSKLRFQHVGLPPECGCFGVCEDAWSFLMGSIKAFAETGRGTPG
ncbi:MAG TPA: hypothetical protein VEJ36_01755 [Nitrososphaerales archaeon]|nr:hypothetical protein [Nitrososphaerales archaeon]